MDRRAFLATGAAASAALALPYRRAWADHRALGAASSSDALPAFGDATLPDDTLFIQTALGAAREAGALYADVQRRHVQAEAWSLGFPAGLRHESGLTVRVFSNGCWGYATAGGIGSVDDAARLGRDAAQRALIAAARRPVAAPLLELAPIGTPAAGTWVMPGIDPFTISFEEKSDFMRAIEQFTYRIPVGAGGNNGYMQFRRERRVFGSSDGAFTTQIAYIVDAGFSYGSRSNPLTIASASYRVPFVTATGAGWEYIRDIPVRPSAEATLEFVSRMRDTRQGDVGRYDVVLDPRSVGSLVAATLGPATELNRAMGYYANSEGSSYLSDPVAMLRDGVRVASPLVTLTANRSMPGGAATVRWDDEGVVPSETTIVRAGALADFQTTRESAAWMRPAARSNGCAGTFGATTPTGQVSPNFVLAPGAGATSMMDLVKSVKKGILAYGASFESDHQALTGTSRIGDMFEITDGQIGKALDNTQILYRSPELWSHVQALGGAASAQPVGVVSSRGESALGFAYHTVHAVPMLISGVAVTNRWRSRA